MSKSKDKKRIIFDIYSNNLKWIKEKTNIEFKIDFEKGLLCPLCLEIFQEKDLVYSEENHLTLEHNPPDSLGGKGNILTCKECNNRSGHKTDIELLNYIKEQEFKKSKPNSKHRSKISNKNGDKITADFSFDSERKATIKFQSKYSNPNDYKKFLEGEEKGYFPVKNDPTKFFTSQFNFDLEIPNKGNERLASIALLKIGYLLAFEKFGHIFLFNHNLDIIRKQILNPEKIIIDKSFWINHIFPDEYLGINLITKPKELSCFLSTFNLKVNTQLLQFSIIFPGYNDSDKNIYDTIEKKKAQKKKENLKMEITSLEPFVNLRDKNRILNSYYIWIKKVGC